MDINIIKESNIEYCENMYALSMNYLKNRNNLELRKLIGEMDNIVDKIKVCNNKEELDKYLFALGLLFDRIEVIINE